MSSNPSEPHNEIIKSLGDLKQEIRFLRKLSVLNYFGFYDRHLEKELKSDLLNNNGKYHPEHEKSSKYDVNTLLLASSILGSAILICFMMIFTRTAWFEDKIGSYLGIASTSKAQPSANNAANNAQQNPNEPKFKEVSIDDDPVLGSKDAPVTIIEFSDYDCPWCKYFYDEIYPSLKKEYIDTGKVKFVYRDLPVKQLHPLAFEKAVAANCAFEQGTDDAYWKYHDELFARAPKPGTPGAQVLQKSDLLAIARDMNLNMDNFTQCLETEKYGDEVRKDINDAINVEAYGTPNFFVGKSTSNGVINGRQIEGAIPFEQLKAIIEEYLK